MNPINYPKQMLLHCLAVHCLRAAKSLPLTALRLELAAGPASPLRSGEPGDTLASLGDFGFSRGLLRAAPGRENTCQMWPIKNQTSKTKLGNMDAGLIWF